jgi:hypothetical protein
MATTAAAAAATGTAAAAAAAASTSFWYVQLKDSVLRVAHYRVLPAAEPAWVRRMENHISLHAESWRPSSACHQRILTGLGISM